MGQAVGQLEPPSVADPLDGALAGGGPTADGHADDLLSELAGAEIDRMLAAADVEPALASPPPAPVVPPPVEIPQPVAAAPVEAAPVEPAKVESAGVPAPEPVAATAPTETPAPAVATADLDSVLAEAAADRTVVSVTSADLDLGNPIPRMPFLLRPLALLNAPLDMLPDSVRDTIGKVAIVTLVNSVAVITYVRFFRHHG